MSVLQCLIPILGVVFFYTGVHVGLYICAGWAILFALQRLPKADIGPMIGIAASLLLAIPMCFIFNESYLPLAAMFVCAEDASNAVISLIKFAKMMKSD